LLDFGYRPINHLIGPFSFGQARILKFLEYSLKAVDGSPVDALLHPTGLARYLLG